MSSGEKGYSNELEQFITSIRLRALEDCRFGERTNPQAQRLVIQIENVLVHKENRKRVLRAITGLPIQSQNELTFWYHSVLIDETKEPEDAVLLRAVEDLVEATAVGDEIYLFPWYWPGTVVPDLQPADLETTAV